MILNFTLVGGLFWILSHRYGQFYMGESTMAVLVIASTVYAGRRYFETHLDPDETTAWAITPWHILAALCPGIVLAGLGRFLI